MYMLIDKDLWEVTEGREACPSPHPDGGDSAGLAEDDKAFCNGARRTIGLAQPLF